MKYDLNGNLTEEQDAEGRVTNHEYDKLNRLTKTIQPALPGLTRGEQVFSYYDEADPKTNLKTESDQEGNVTGYEYNGRYLRSKRTNALNYIHLWEYDDAGNLSKETDEEGHSVRHEYDRQNRLIADVRSHNGADIKTGYGYDAAGNRTSVTDPLGRITSTGYDEWNRAWRAVDADNYIVTTELDGEGNKVKTIDANNVARGWTRDQRGLVLSSIDGEGFETRYTYELNGNNETVTYANTSVTSIAYDAEDRKTITTEAQGQSEERSSGVVLYDKVGNPLQVKDGNGNITTTGYNALNLPVRIIDAKGNSSTSDYYKTGKIKTATNRRTATTTTEYDKLWRVTKVTDPLNQIVESTYDKVGNVTQSKDKRGITSETIYDDLYRPVEKKRDNLRLAGMEYDNAGNLAADIDANGNRTEYSYTKRNQKEKATFADATVRRMTYDGNGNLKSETDEEGIVTSHAYDRENRPTAIERAGELTQKSYNEMGDLVAIIHPEGNSRTYNYDKLKRMISAIDDPWGTYLTTRYEYDKNGNLTKTTDARGNVVENTYDELNRKTSHTQRKASGNLVTGYEYDEEGNLTKLTDAKLQVSTYVYDLLNRKTNSHYAGLDITTGYDENNNVTSSSTPADSTSNVYDNFDRLKTSTQRGTAVNYTYDNNGNRLSVGTPTSTTGYSYDARNRVKTASAGSATTNFDYYADGKKKSASYPNGAKEEYEYYPTNRVKTLTNSLNSAVISKFAYSYDRNGNRLNQDETRGTRNISTGYTYDSLDRMASYSVTENSATTRTDYTFDGYNRKTETTTKPDSSSITRTYGYDETDWLTQLQDGSKTITYSYDNNGNTIKKADSTAPGNDIVFEYDARDKLTRTGKGATVLGTYAYNANGYRIRQLGSDRGDVEYYYDGTAVIEERNSAGLLAHYRYANKLYSLFDGTQSQYYHLDALGSTTDLTDDTGATKASYFLNPWGMIVDSVGSSVNRRIFTGKEIDRNTGLVYFGARYYDPDTARFTTQDTYLGEQGTPPSLHRYLYAYSNPTVFIDLEGYESISVDKKGNVHWKVETDAIISTKETRRVKIGTLNKGKVELTQEFGGGIVAHNQLKKAASNFWTKQSDISRYKPEGQNQIIRVYIDDALNPHNEPRLKAEAKQSPPPGVTAIKAWGQVGEWIHSKLTGDDKRAQTVEQRMSESHDENVAALHEIGPVVVGGIKAPKTGSIPNASAKNAASSLPQIKGGSVKQIGKTLKKAGFTLERQTSTGNQTWNHPDGSQVRVDPYGNQSLTMQNGQPLPKSGANAHVHKYNPNQEKLNDHGITSNLPEDTHIGIKNPSNYPQVRNRPHGSGE